MRCAPRDWSFGAGALLAAGLVGCPSVAPPSDLRDGSVSTSAHPGAEPAARDEPQNTAEGGLLVGDAALLPGRLAFPDAAAKATVLDWHDDCSGLDVSAFTFTYRNSAACCDNPDQATVTFVASPAEEGDGCTVRFAGEDRGVALSFGRLQTFQVDVLAELSAHLRAHLSALPVSADPWELAVDEACLPHRIVVRHDANSAHDRTVLVCPRLAGSPRWLSDAEALANELLGHPHDCGDDAAVKKCLI